MQGVEDLLLEVPELSDLQKRILIIRFCGIIKHYRSRVRLVSCLFNIMRFIVTVGSLLVPALLSIQSPGSVSAVTSSDTIYWSTWAVSLAVTMSNGILALFKIDKKYFTLNTVLEQLTSEGWQYLELSGRYSGHFGDHIHKPTHKNQFVFFCNSVEKIVMRQVEDEFYKVNEGTGSATNTGSPQSILPPSPSDIITVQTPTAQPLERESAVINRGKTWSSDAAPVLKMTHNVQKMPEREDSSVNNTVKQDTVSVPPLETSPSLILIDGPKPQLSGDHTIVSHTQ
jgi:Protein of unknown function (DUF4231)